MTKYAIEEDSNQFFEIDEDGCDPMSEQVILEDGTTAPGYLVLNENQIEFLNGDIQAIFAINEGDKTLIGIISDDELLVSGLLENSSFTALLNLLGQCHNDHNLNHK